MKLIRTLILALVLLGGAQALRAELVNGIMVIVNDTVITFQQVQLALAPYAELLATRFAGQPDKYAAEFEKARTEKIQELVERQLILHEFKTAGFNLPENFVDDSVKRRITERFGNRATLTKTLQAEGMTFETYRQQQREQIIVEAMRQKHISQEKVLISPFKIEEYYLQHQDAFKMSDQVKLRTIVLNKTPGNAAAARKLAEDIQRKLKDGAAFAEMASVYSEDAFRRQGGERGWVDRNYFKKELTDAAFALKAGQVSEVIELPEACYLLKADEVKTAHTRPLSDVREEIENTLKGEERARLQQKWMDRLKKKSFVRYF